jgi:hypothetical protein
VYKKFEDNVIVNSIQKQNVKKIRRKNFISFDVENNINTGDFICAAIYGEIKKENGRNLIIEQYYDNKDKFHEGLLYYTSKPNFYCTVYNGAYDEAFIREITDDSKTLRTMDRVIKIELINGGEIFDIQNISGIEYSLEYWIEALNMYKNYGLKKESLDDLKLRVMSDAKATWILTDFIQEYFINTWNSNY